MKMPLYMEQSVSYKRGLRSCFSGGKEGRSVQLTNQVQIVWMLRIVELYFNADPLERLH
jgi:hypothetical protein